MFNPQFLDDKLIMHGLFGVKIFSFLLRIVEDSVVDNTFQNSIRSTVRSKLINNTTQPLTAGDRLQTTQTMNN